MSFAIFRAVISVGFKGDITLLLCLLAKIKYSILIISLIKGILCCIKPSKYFYVVVPWFIM